MQKPSSDNTSEFTHELFKYITLLLNTHAWDDILLGTVISQAWTRSSAAEADLHSKDGWPMLTSTWLW